jgi:hypothetical protein
MKDLFYSDLIQLENSLSFELIRSKFCPDDQAIDVVKLEQSLAAIREERLSRMNYFIGENSKTL